MDETLSAAHILFSMSDSRRKSRHSLTVTQSHTHTLTHKRWTTYDNLLLFRHYFFCLLPWKWLSWRQSSIWCAVVKPSIHRVAFVARNVRMGDIAHESTRAHCVRVLSLVWYYPVAVATTHLVKKSFSFQRHNEGENGLKVLSSNIKRSDASALVMCGSFCLRATSDRRRSKCEFHSDRIALLGQRWYTKLQTDGRHAWLVLELRCN